MTAGPAGRGTPAGPTTAGASLALVRAQRFDFCEAPPSCAPARPERLPETSAGPGGVTAGAAPADGAAGASAVARALDRIAASDGALRAWAHVDTGAGQHSPGAGAVEAGAVAGMPIGVKDIIDVAGMPCAAGFAPLADRVPECHAAIVQRLVDAGAVVVGKTVTTQFAFSDPAVTRNPWDAARTPGGSSSGSAAAVAAGHVPAALGTQTAGSVIRPAAYTGVTGFKPTAGRLPLSGVTPLAWTLDEVGFLTRGIEECALLFAAAGAGPIDLDREPQRSLRLGLLDDALALSDEPATSAVTGATRALAAAGAEVIAMSLGCFPEILAAHRVIMLSEIASLHADTLPDNEQHYGPMLARAVAEGGRIDAAGYLKAQRLRSHLRARVLDILAGVDALLLPSVSAEAPSRETTGDRRLQIPASLLGLPTVTIPSGLSPSGLPLGLQVVAAPGDDERLLELAAWIRRTASLPRGLRPPVPDGKEPA